MSQSPPRVRNLPESVSRDVGDKPARQDLPSSPVSPRGPTTPSIHTAGPCPALPCPQALAQADTALLL